MDCVAWVIAREKSDIDESILSLAFPTSNTMKVTTRKYTIPVCHLHFIVSWRVSDAAADVCLVPVTTKRAVMHFNDDQHDS